MFITTVSRSGATRLIQAVESPDLAVGGEDLVVQDVLDRS
jgi:hypothetical protein